MKMSNNPAKYEVLIKQYLRSILDISEGGISLGKAFFSLFMAEKTERLIAGNSNKESSNLDLIRFS